QEHRVRRAKLVDNRVHACVYFIQPHRLKQIDIEFMRRLHHRVNLIPVIAKADTMSEEEILDFKARILSDLEFNGISIFQAPIYEDEDEESILEAEEIARAIPFAVVGSNNFVRTRDGSMVRGRAYPWGVVEVDNPEHCDFGLLRRLLVRTNMEELRLHTNDVLYEAWRTERLLAMGFTQDPSVFQEASPAEELRQQREIHEAKLAKMEAAMKEVFREKVELQEQKLKQSEVELYARHKEIKDALDKQREELLRKKAQLEGGMSPDASVSEFHAVETLECSSICRGRKHSTSVDEADASADIWFVSLLGGFCQALRIYDCLLDG
ncbi:Septin-domain-containing protein, partial [Mycena haematopus]